MKNGKLVSTFIGGLVLGLTLALCLGAEDKPKKPKSDWSRVKVVGYPNGTGFFDPDTGKMYVYDDRLQGCFIIRQLVALGQPME